MRSNAVVAIAMSLSLGLSSCAAQGGLSSNQTTGAGVGCLVGMVVGMALTRNKDTGAALGCAAGGALGFTVGSALDEREKRELAEASIRAAAHARTGERIAWGAQIQNAEPSPSTQQTVTASSKKHSKKGKKDKVQTASNSASGWVSPGTTTKTAPVDPNAASGWVVPVSDTYVASNGQTCRDLQQTANKGGKTYQQNIRACQTAQGWIVPQA